MTDQESLTAGELPHLHQGAAQPQQLPHQHGRAEGGGTGFDQPGREEPGHRECPLQPTLRGGRGLAEISAR